MDDRGDAGARLRPSGLGELRPGHQVGVAPVQGAEPKEEAKRAEVLVLGTYHMANPGRDIFNMQGAGKEQADAMKAL